MRFGRNPEYKFVSTDVNPLLADLLAGFERITGRVATPGSNDRLYVQWVANIIIHERALNNYTGNQNLPSRADGENLDELGQLFNELVRPEAKPAASKQRFHLSAVQNTSILIPAGTRVSDARGTLTWRTEEDSYIPIGEQFTDVAIECLTPGVAGNNFALGQINTLVDVDNVAYFQSTENVTVSDGGSDRADDDEYYRLMRESRGSKSTAGARNAYIYFAKMQSTEIADVVPVAPSAGQVNIYILMKDGTIAGEEIKQKVYDACSADDVRPLTDYVVMDDPEIIEYEIDFEYYIPSRTETSSADIEAAVKAAVDDYIAWQCGALGRDINPDELRQRVRATGGVKRIVLHSPEFLVLRDGRQRTPKESMVPQIAAIRGSPNIVNGGFEDE